ncbi:hypothetical protein F4694_005667 [Bacillus niacini]|uniref:Uncharacterized protein n=1 Tax=Neobacillus niacini TaxID=86668 RepID=A0A852TKW4_9BACI|nr:hypothetical protein [Neobacillus niacini]
MRVAVSVEIDSDHHSSHCGAVAKVVLKEEAEA